MVKSFEPAEEGGKLDENKKGFEQPVATNNSARSNGPHIVVQSNLSFQDYGDVIPPTDGPADKITYATFKKTTPTPVAHHENSTLDLGDGLDLPTKGFQTRTGRDNGPVVPEKGTGFDGKNK